MAFDRRDFIKGSLAAGTLLSGAAAGAAERAQSGARRHRTIAVEESFSIPEISQESVKFLMSPEGREQGWEAMARFYADQSREWGERSLDLGEGRIAAMDAGGIDVQLLLLGSMGLQSMDAARATELTALANDRLAEAVRRYPQRFAGLTALAPQDPEAAALELERGVKRLGLKGAVINSHARGEYLDDPKYLPIFEAAAALDVPIYLHPSLPAPQMVRPFLDYGLIGPMWGYAAETAVHALRLILCGLFDRFPRLTIVLGHLGEGIPYFLTRIDTQHLNTQAQRTPKLKRLPSEYFRDNFYVTTSGMNASPAVMFCHQVLGADRMMLAIDYPYEPLEEEMRAFERQPLPEADRAKICHLNAERVFRLGDGSTGK